MTGEGKASPSWATHFLARPLTGPRASTSLSGTPHYVAPERIRGVETGGCPHTAIVGLREYLRRRPNAQDAAALRDKLLSLQRQHGSLN